MDPTSWLIALDTDLTEVVYMIIGCIAAVMGMGITAWFMSRR